MLQTYEYPSCPYAKELGLKPKDPTKECKDCPFFEDCLEDILGDAKDIVDDALSKRLNGKQPEFNTDKVLHKATEIINTHIDDYLKRKVQSGNSSH